MQQFQSAFGDDMGHRPENPVSTEIGEIWQVAQRSKSLFL